MCESPSHMMGEEFEKFIRNSPIRKRKAAEEDPAFAVSAIVAFDDRVPLRPSGTSPCGGGNPECRVLSERYT